VSPHDLAADLKRISVCLDVDGSIEHLATGLRTHQRGQSGVQHLHLLNEVYHRVEHVEQAVQRDDCLRASLTSGEHRLLQDTTGCQRRDLEGVESAEADTEAADLANFGT
jgi:hypothetical protein